MIKWSDEVYKEQTISYSVENVINYKFLNDAFKIVKNITSNIDFKIKFSIFYL